MARVLAVLSAVITMLLWGPLLVGLAFGTADSPSEDLTLWQVAFWWVFIAWPIASAAAVACATVLRRWPRLVAYLLVLVAVAMGFPLVLNGVIALAAALFCYLYSRASEAPGRQEPPSVGPPAKLEEKPENGVP